MSEILPFHKCPEDKLDSLISDVRKIRDRIVNIEESIADNTERMVAGLDKLEKRYADMQSSVIELTRSIMMIGNDLKQAIGDKISYEK